jgi:hypothetical protein
MFSTSQQLEAQEDHFSRQDAIRERYACQIEDARREVLIWQEEQEYMTKVWEAGYGTDYEAYEAAWKRTLQYYESQRD